MRRLGIFVWVLVVAGVTAALGSQLSGNIVVGGDFESVNAIKMLDSPRTQAELDAGTNPVRSWGFHPGGIAAEDAGGYTAGQHFDDFGKWIGAWGISTSDNRNASTAPNNVSLVNRGGSNTHVMDGARFRSWVAQVVQAPANHVSGQATINFDYYFNQWEDVPVGADSIFHVWIGGMNTLPTAFDRAGPIWGGHLDGSDEPAGGGKWSLNPIWDSPNWSTLWDPSGQSWTGIGAYPAKPLTGSEGATWHSLSTSYPSSVTFNIDTPYQYYYISMWQCVYSEGHEYFWMYGGKIIDQLAIAIDNIDLRVSVASAVVLGDVNLDGNVNALDISGFINRLTTGTYQAEADINEDLAVNALDISGFVSCLTGGACGNGVAGGSAVPEPASVSFALVSLALLRRR